MGTNGWARMGPNGRPGLGANGRARWGANWLPGLVANGWTGRAELGANRATEREGRRGLVPDKWARLATNETTGWEGMVANWRTSRCPAVATAKYAASGAGGDDGEGTKGPGGPCRVEIF